MSVRRIFVGLSVLGIVATVSMVVWSGIGTMADAEAESGSLCASCHVETHDLGAHTDLTCDNCHAIEDASELLRADFGLRDVPIHGGVGEACGACHQDAPGSALVAEGHATHRADCGSCHESHGSNRIPCASCHADVTLRGALAELSCTTCHSFGAAPTTEIIPTAPSSAGVDVATLTDNLHGSMDCRRCHDPHRQEPIVVECTSCHRAHLLEASETGPAGHRDCRGCHEPHAPRSTPAVDCLGCHVYPREGHGWDTRLDVDEDAIAATQQRITHEGRCGSCHEPHGWAATEQRCRECHEPETASLLPLDMHAECMSCHEAHEPRPTGAVCEECHANVHAGGPAAHRNCLSCHDAHAGRPDSRSACGSCHQDAHATSRAGRHRECLSCHLEHGEPLGPTDGACASCHEAIEARLDAATVPSLHECATCHRPHAFERESFSSCVGCHAGAARGSASHRGECTECHEQHAAPMGAANECGACHAAVQPGVREHAECQGCHAPHQPAIHAGTQCGTCHARITAAARTWPAATAHGGRCAECHQPHSEAERRECTSCHQRQANRAHTGGVHTECVGCHAPHAAVPSQGWWDRCSACHEDQSSAVEGSTGTHGDCEACHTTPGPPLPTCQTCHAGPARLLHQSHAEEDCSSCHSTHGHTSITRLTCVECHDDRTTHFPEAVCQSCHPF